MIAGMEAALAAEPQARIAGYEADGGFLLGFTATGPAGAVAALPTPDNSRILHLRPAGNAPELRCYTVAAQEMLTLGLERLRENLAAG